MGKGIKRKNGTKQDCACNKHRDSPSHLPLGHGEKNRVCDNDGNMEECLDPQYRGASLKPELPGKRRSRRLLSKWCRHHPVYVVVLAVLVALVLALAVAVAVLSAGRDGASAAVVLGCPDDWVGYRNVCYYLSREEGSWEWSQERCSSLGASLAVIKREREMDFLLRLKGNIDYWVGLHRQDGHLEWVDGSSFNHTSSVETVQPSQHNAHWSRAKERGKWCRHHPVYAMVLALVLALAAAVAVLSAGRDGASAAAVLGCPDDWVGYRNVCYYLSREEGSWEWSQERCSSLGASLAVIKREWEMEFLSRLRGNIDYWVGLRRQDGRLEWVDGSSFNHTALIGYAEGEGCKICPSGWTLRGTECYWAADETSSWSESQEDCVNWGAELLMLGDHDDQEGVGNGKWCRHHPVYAMVLAVLVALVLALAVAVAVLSAGRDGASVAAVLGCPDDWVGYRNVCYYLSREEGSWEWSQERCSSLGASLAVIKREWEMEFLSRLRGNIDYWVGLRRQDGCLEWVDGSSFNHT
ncbi:C-type lectin domain family 2 member B [Columba guinea]|nr:C-type lectin domain family 2 member B [Columba guinea]